MVNVFLYFTTKWTIPIDIHFQMSKFTSCKKHVTDKFPSKELKFGSKIQFPLTINKFGLSVRFNRGIIRPCRRLLTEKVPVGVNFNYYLQYYLSASECYISNY